MERFYKSMGVLLFLFCWGSIALAQTGDVRGFIYNKDTGEPVLFANVFLEGTTYGAAADENGFYSINKVPVGEYTLLTTYIGFDTSKVVINIKANQILNQKLFISESDVLLSTFEVEGAKQEQQTEVRTSTIKITPQQINKIPAIGGEPDLAQYLQVLPGVVFTGDQGGQLYIRGGSQIQTKVLLDGLTIYNPFHSIGLFSVFETDLLSNVEVMTGGFNAEYSGRISAVIDIKTKDGNKKRMAGKVAANTFLAKAILEGPIVKLTEDRDLSASYVFSAKTSYLDRTSPLLYSYINEDGLPYNFTDLYGKVSMVTGNGSRINFSGFRFSDNANFLQLSDYFWDSWGLGSSFVLIPGQSKTIIDGFFSFSNYGIRLEEADANARFSKIGGFNGGINFSYFLPKGDIKYGIELSGFSTEFEFFNALNYKLEENQFTTEIGGYLKYRSELFDAKLLFEPSLRVNFYASLPTFALEPRLGIKYNVNNDLRFKASGGIYTQNFISTKSDRDVVNLFTGFLSAPDVTLRDINGEQVDDNLQRALHGIAGVEIDLTRGLEMNTEVYYKGFGQLININRRKFTNADPDYIIEEGAAYGIDFLLKYDYKNLFLWGVYSLGYVTRDDGQQNYPPHFDRRHNVNFLASYQFGRDLGWEASIRWNLGSGFPFTQTQGFYEDLNLTGGIDVDYISQNGNLAIIYDDELNGGRLPYYHRMDLSLKKTWLTGVNSKLEASASVTNVYDRKNIFYFDRIRYTRINQLPILPSAGISFSF